MNHDSNTAMITIFQIMENKQALLESKFTADSDDLVCKEYNMRSVTFFSVTSVRQPLHTDQFPRWLKVNETHSAKSSKVSLDIILRDARVESAHEDFLDALSGVGWFGVYCSPV